MIYLPLPKGRARTGEPMRKVLAFVVHYAGAPGGHPRGMWHHFVSTAAPGKIPASSHYAIALDGELYRFIPESEEAFTHGAGAAGYTAFARSLFVDAKRGVYPHDKSIGVEVCHPDASGIFTAASRRALVELGASVVSRHRLERWQVVRHYDITAKLCPKYYVEHPVEWDRLRDDIMRAAKGRTFWSFAGMGALALGIYSLNRREA